MSKRAEKAASRALPNYPPETYADNDEYIEVESERSMQRAFYQKGYEQAEKDAVERAMEWLFSNVRDYLYCCIELGTPGITPEFFSDFKKAMEEN